MYVSYVAARRITTSKWKVNVEKLRAIKTDNNYIYICAIGFVIAYMGAVVPIYIEILLHRIYLSI